MEDRQGRCRKIARPFRSLQPVTHMQPFSWGAAQGCASTRGTAGPRAVRAQLPYRSGGHWAARSVQGLYTQPTPTAWLRERKLSTHHRAEALDFLPSGWTREGGKRGKEAGSRGDRQEARCASYIRYQDRPRTARRTRKDSPTAQRSANRSSPSSAWIRSFRLFLVAALFNTALNKGGGGACMSQHPAHRLQGGGVSAEGASIFLGSPILAPGAPLSLQSKGDKEFGGDATFPFLHDDVSATRETRRHLCRARPGLQPASPAAHTPRPGKSREIRQVCRGGQHRLAQSPRCGFS